MIRGYLHHLTAVRCVGRGDFENALASYEQALECDPEDAFARSMIAQCHRWKGDATAAIAAAIRAVQAMPDDYYSLKLLGELYAERGEHVTARPYVERSLAALPQRTPVSDRVALMLTYLVGLLPGVRVRSEEVDAIRHSDRDRERWVDWARGYLASCDGKAGPV